MSPKLIAQNSGKNNSIRLNNSLKSVFLNSGIAIVLLLLTLLIPLSNTSKSSGREEKINKNSQSTHTPNTNPQLCPESRRWPLFCSAILNTSLLNKSSIKEINGQIINAKEQFCDMIRILNKIDCAQPFTVSPKWRIGCQEAYRDWTCSLLAEPHLPSALRQCDSTCHQVIRTCPYLSPDRIQYDSQGRLNSHPSQYGGHPTFYCPTTFTNEQSTENIYFDPSSLDSDTICILFNPNYLNLTSTAFPLSTIQLNNLSFTYCQDHASLNPGTVHSLLNTSRVAKVKSCCWTYNTALPKTYSHLSATLRKSVLKDENCVALGERDPDSPPYLYEENVNEKENYFKEILLQCEVWQEPYEEYGQQNTKMHQEGDLDHFYVDDEAFPEEMHSPASTTFGYGNSDWDLDEEEQEHKHHINTMDSIENSETESEDDFGSSSNTGLDNTENNDSLFKKLRPGQAFSESDDDTLLLEDYSNEDSEYEHENKRKTTTSATTRRSSSFISSTDNFIEIIPSKPNKYTSTHNSKYGENNANIMSTTQASS